MSQQATVVKMPLSETSKKYLGINIDTKRDELLSEQAKKLVEDYYCRKKETSPQEAYARAAVAYSYGDMDLAQRIYDYVSKGWFMYASPVLSNAPKPDEKAKALPISCFLTYVPDSLEGLIDNSIAPHSRVVSRKIPIPLVFRTRGVQITNTLINDIDFSVNVVRRQ